jgi:hypothetical protein
MQVSGPAHGAELPMLLLCSCFQPAACTCCCAWSKVCRSCTRLCPSRLVLHGRGTGRTGPPLPAACSPCHMPEQMHEPSAAHHAWINGCVWVLFSSDPYHFLATQTWHALCMPLLCTSTTGGWRTDSPLMSPPHLVRQDNNR